jgi:hemoglobin/transferrin/lactoferrin receptor protein
MRAAPTPIFIANNSNSHIFQARRGVRPAPDAGPAPSRDAGLRCGKPALYALACFALGLGGPAAAQTSSASSAAIPAPVTVLDPITVTATRNPVSSFSYPGMVSVASSEILSRRMASSLDDALRQTPGLSFAGGPRRSGEVPSLRGFSGQDVILLLDGARQNYESGHDGRLFVDPSLLKSVEVVRGPSSALYGSGGLGGVIALETLDPEDLVEPGETMAVEWRGGFQSAADEWHTGFTAGFSLENFGALAALTLRDSDDLRLGDGSRLIADDAIVTGLAKLRGAPAEGVAVEVSVQRFNNDAVEPNNGQSATANDFVDKDIRSDTWRGEVTAKPGPAWLDLRTILYHTDQQVDETRRDQNAGGAIGNRLTRDVKTTGATIDNRATVSFGDRGKAVFTGGFEYYRDRQEGLDSLAAAQVRGGVPNAKLELVGGFVQSEVTLSQPLALPGTLTLIPALRYDRFTSTSAIAERTENGAWSPKIALGYQPTGWSTLFASYAKAFRAPSINDIYADGIHFRIGTITNFFIPNPQLRPQRTETFEIGGGLRFNDVLSTRDSFQLKAAHYWTDGTDLIDTVVTQPTIVPACFQPVRFGGINCNGTTQIRNVRAGDLDGFEIEAGYENARVLASLTFTTIDGRDRATGRRLGQLTPDTITGDIAYRWRAIDSVIGWRLTHAAAFDKVNDPAERRDGYTLNDLYVVWSPRAEAFEGLSLSLGIDNLFDVAYARVFTEALETGRNYKLQIAYRIGW